MRPDETDESAQWAPFGKQNWRCGMNQTPGLRRPMRERSLDPMKGVGCSRQSGRWPWIGIRYGVCNNSPTEGN
ncbi:hypothetical protein JTE90_000811 [Oedothorax gibbosus]|uniref:Uncharacterized protein n=1 Tax=Oedothorax gibbosus TaxID=931172 RepID=A0AAV6TEM5_9ARAC|nr:hypothetical protein JTE90_000811 [Oedothorax gibbosus]